MVRQTVVSSQSAAVRERWQQVAVALMLMLFVGFPIYQWLSQPDVATLESANYRQAKMRGDHDAACLTAIRVQQVHSQAGDVLQAAAWAARLEEDCAPLDDKMRHDAGG